MVSADVGQARVDQGVTNMASHIVGFVNSVGIVFGSCIFAAEAAFEFLSIFHYMLLVLLVGLASVIISNNSFSPDSKSS